MAALIQCVKFLYVVDIYEVFPVYQFQLLGNEQTIKHCSLLIYSKIVFK